MTNKLLILHFYRNCIYTRYQWQVNKKWYNIQWLRSLFSLSFIGLKQLIGNRLRKVGSHKVLNVNQTTVQCSECTLMYTTEHFTVRAGKVYWKLLQYDHNSSIDVEDWTNRCWRILVFHRKRWWARIVCVNLSYH